MMKLLVVASLLAFAAASVIKTGPVAVGGQSATLTLTEDKLSYAIGSVNTELLVYDIYAVESINLGFRVHAFPLAAAHCKKPTRAFKTFEFSAADADSWISVLQRTIIGLAPDAALPSRRAKVFVNPHSGEGKSANQWKEVQPMLEAAGFQLDVSVVTHGKEVKDGAKHLDCNAFDYVVGFGGDGTLNKVVNGLMKRSDWKACMDKLVFHHMPGGSGNGLATNVLTASGLEFGINEAAFLLTKAPAPGYVNTIPLMAYETALNGTEYGFLSTEWGIASDLDEESEYFRWLGKNRFYISSLIRAIDLRRYKARFSYLPADQALTPVRPADDARVNALPAITEPVPGNWVSTESEFIMVYVCQLPWMASNALVAPGVRVGQDTADILILPGSASRLDVVELLLGYSDGSHVTKVKNLNIVHARAFRLEPLDAGTKKLPGHVGVDGDFIPPQVTQGQLNPAAMKVVFKAPKQELPEFY